jgi:hypothetical protein
MSLVATKLNSVEAIKNSLPFIGRGAYAHVYMDVSSNTVYAINNDRNCKAKKYLSSMIADSDNIPKHIPKIKQEFSEDKFTVYSMPYYFAVETSDRVLGLSNEMTDYCGAYFDFDYLNRSHAEFNVNIEESFYECLYGSEFPESIKNAIEWIYSKVMDKMNFLEYLYWDIDSRNLGIDRNGDLILMDIFSVAKYIPR